MPANLISVFLRLQHGNEVDARPHLLACEFTVAKQHVSVHFFPQPAILSLLLPAQVLLVLPDSLSNTVEPVRAHGAHRNEVVGRPEAAGREVAAVLDGRVALRRGHILRHDGGAELSRAFQKCRGRW